MAKTDFRYSDLDFFRSVAPDYGKYLSRLHLKDFTQVLSSKWQMGSVGTKPSVVYFNGIEGTKVDSSAGNVNSSRKWFYDEDADLLTIYVSSTGNNPNDDEVIEIGEDTKTFIEQQLTNASMLLNSLITSVVTPIQKSFIFNDGSATETPEYDYVLKQAECFLAFSNMANAEGDFELADRLYDKVTNFDKTGIVDKINDGSIQLAPFREAVDDRGRIISDPANTSTLILVEVSGRYTGRRYEKYKIEFSATGVLGTNSPPKMKIYSSDGDKLWGTVSEEITISGGHQPIGGGLFVRFEGNASISGDKFWIEVKNDEPTNAKARSVNLWR